MSDEKADKKARAPVVAQDAQPDPSDVPVGIDDWEGTKAPPWRLLLVGFRHSLRVKGGLRKQQSITKWDAEFEGYAFEPKGR